MLFQKAKLTLPAILFLVLLRLAIGWHFFQEGAVKVKEGFSSTPFLAAAKGPFADRFHSMIPDHDGMIRIDAKKMSDACDLYGQKIKSEFALNEEQSKEVDEILAQYKATRKETYDEWKPQIDEYKNGFERLAKLRVDAARSKVDSLRKQQEEIESKWRALGRPVLSEIDNTIPEMVNRLNAIATDDQANPKPEKPPAKDANGNPIRKRVEFKFDGEGPISVKLVDKIIPIFDMSIGILLLLGLLTPLAGLAAGLFLASVVVSQFPGFPGTQPTYYQAIEMLGCFVVAFADAGRYAGLDFIPWSFWNRKSKVPVYKA
jgi:uncharacterized membrane protein YphA (DoxX/SURF4 family)/polyhydroxyalkanoate synthesis regulator phasin